MFNLLSLQGLNLQANANSSAPHLFITRLVTGAFQSQLRGKFNTFQFFKGKSGGREKKSLTYRNCKEHLHIPTHSTQS